MRHFYTSTLNSTTTNERMLAGSSSTATTMPTNSQKRGLDLSEQLEHLAPIEFFDAITHELMRTPFTLPSGKNVDKSTLDHCLASQSDPSSGATDPFTRLPFTEERKPTLNTELKAQIDNFFATNGQSEIDRRNALRRRLLAHLS